MESDLNKKDQHNRRNNIEILGVPSNIGDDSLKDKVIEMLAEVHIMATKSNVEDCHRLGQNVSTIVRFVSRKSVMTFWKKMTFTKILTSLNLVLLMALKSMLLKI